MSRDLKCDFCAAPDPTWIVPARPFAMGMPADPDSGRWSYSMGGWMACETCASLVRRARPIELVRRAVRSIRRADRSVPERVVRRTIEELHGRFWAEREGPPRHLTEAELAEIRAMPHDVTSDEMLPTRPLPIVIDIIEGRKP